MSLRRRYNAGAADARLGISGRAARFGVRLGLCEHTGVTSHDKPHFVVPGEEPAEIAPARDSASVIVARDGVGGLEVFMLERHLNSDFAGGAYVFPGGKLDDSDRDSGYA